MYKIKFDEIIQQLNSIERDNGDGTITYILPDPANTDYQAFLAWIAEGNAPLPSDEPPAETE
jgi:hypothetical protein